MFRTRITLSILLFLSCSALLFSYLFGVNKRDYRSYRKLMESSQPGYYKKGVNKQEGVQRRYHVTKNMWFSDKNKRLKLILDSETSELFLTQENNHTSVTENMQNITGFMQQKLYYALPDGREVTEDNEGNFLVKETNPPYNTVPLNEINKLIPMQQVRYFKAKNASYAFQTQILHANDAEIKVFKCPGHELTPIVTDMVMMQGQADTLEFSFVDEAPVFKIYNLDALFFDKTSLL